MTPSLNRIAHIESWKKTSLGTPIELFSSRPLTELRDQKPLLLIGGVHGDEPEGVRLARETLSWLKTQDENVIVPWILIPSLNVDGLAKKTRGNARGVDLNRNYPSADWTPKFEKERYFPGPAPASEPEVQGIVELIRDFKPRLIIHCHSWNPCIVGTGPRAQTDAKRLSESSGYELVPEIGYPTPGSLSRYGWHDLSIPIICIEEDDKNPDFDAIWPRFQTGMTAVFKDRSLREEAK